ncbi:MAG: RuvC family protein [Nitrososphaerales archaeon]
MTHNPPSNCFFLRERAFRQTIKAATIYDLTSSSTENLKVADCLINPSNTHFVGQWVGSIGTASDYQTEVAVATSDGKAYYKITSFLKHVGISFRDLILWDAVDVPSNLASSITSDIGSVLDNKSRLIITTRKERIQLVGANIICIEDLGDDFVLAKEKFLSILYPSKDEDSFIVGIDPGERTGVAAFINHREIESTVLTSIADIVARVSKLVDNSPKIRRIVRIGYGNPRLAVQIAEALESQCKNQLRIQLVDESGTSTLVAKRSPKKSGTRDQRAAKLIAFREGQEFLSVDTIGTNAHFRH